MPAGGAEMQGVLIVFYVGDRGKTHIFKADSGREPYATMLNGLDVSRAVLGPSPVRLCVLRWNSLHAADPAVYDPLLQNAGGRKN